MLFIVIILAIVAYTALFTFWNSLEPQTRGTVHMAATWRDIVFAIHEPSVLIVLKEIILLSVAYVIVDFVVSSIRRRRRRQAPPPLSWRTHKLPDYSEPL